ncbi:Gamma-thionin family protein [Chryseobacterium polytrichastri]|uniref:Gamma-thionin family protein n=1 Tax=Chryseobacterium polytrichastri TaxID=1302687 RepID=A0A1M7LB61_9FLAO|nr:Gamma-thionin family protein [Chryseobacterium polytrichastri]
MKTKESFAKKLNRNQMKTVYAGDSSKLCSVPSSSNFLCISDRKCAQVCASEGYADGSCQGLRIKCICRKPC